jgi:signal transduction histidine kinase
VLLGRLRIRGKLIVLVLIPLLVVAGLTVTLVLERLDEANRAAATADRVAVAARIGSLVQNLQQERLLSAGYLLGVANQSDLTLQIATDTDQVTDIRADLGAGLPADVARALDQVTSLSEVRTAVQARGTDIDRVMAAYGPVTTGLIDALGITDDADVGTPEGRQLVALDALIRSDEATTAGAADLLNAAATKFPASISAFASDLTVMNEELARFHRYATPAQQKLYGLVTDGLAARTGDDFLASFAVAPDQVIATLTPEQLYPSLASFIVLGRFVEHKIATDVTAVVTARQTSDERTAAAIAGLAVAVLLVVVLLSAAVARAVATPLTRLTLSADRVARVAQAELTRVADDESEHVEPVRLDPVDVRASDEIGNLARAFERVQTTAAQLVERQVASRRNVAQMFGHVGRRTQNLVSRQTALIDRLEHQEADPRRLRDLYRLDHIASRLHRNAGSLVVLSGGAAGTDGHGNPLRLADVVRLALGEIEDYPRVTVDVPADIVLTPAAIGDLILVLAELMENATAFSPPDTRVTVAATATRAGARCTVTDHGIGLSPDRLAEENSRLARRERLDLAPTRVLGLFVVGRLARRHGLAVELTPTPGGGVTATVDLPSALLIPTPTPHLQPISATPWPALALPAAPTPLEAPPVERDPQGDLGGLASLDALADRFDRALPGALADPVEPEPAAATDPGVPEETGDAASGWPTITGRAAVPERPAALPFDVGALTRANHAFERGPSWDAFSIEPPAWPPQPPADSDADPTTDSGDEADDVSFEQTTVRFLDQPGPVAGSPGSTAGGEPGALRRRVPGAQLPDAAAGPARPLPDAHPHLHDAPGRAVQARRHGPARAVPPRPGDAEAVQALVEDFQDGIRRAQEETAPVPDASAGLSRRVPGATLDDEPAHARRTGRPEPVQDPEAVRDLVEAFEAGVVRALRESRPADRHQEGTR